MEETRNVSYQGTVQKAEASIYMQGTHRLELSDGRFVLLESADLELDRYIGKPVAVLGAVRPTVEGDGMILRVEQITLLQEESSSSEILSNSSSESSDVSSSEESSSSSSSSVAVSSKAVVSSAAPSSKAAASSVAITSVASSTASSSSAALTMNEELDAKTATMAKADLADAKWTQQYCSTHIGFCFPVHKNWYFNSFGTTTSYLWHVEIGTTEINDLGEGPLVVNLMSGGIGSLGKTAGTVETQGEFAVGYQAFNDTSHFEISAPKSLQAAVQYISNHITKQ